MGQAKSGDAVKIHYDGFLDDGTLFGSSRGEKPVEFTIGAGEVIPGFENAVINMEEGDTKTVTISPEDGFGRYKEALVKTISTSKLPSNIEPKVGKVLVLRADAENDVRATIRDVTEKEVTLDVNHPLAEKELKVEIELLEITT